MRFYENKDPLRWGLAVLRGVIPPKCWSCQQWLSGDQRKQKSYPFICVPCYEKLPWTDPEYSCAHCGHQTAETNRAFCHHCIDRRFHFDRLWSGFHYEEKVQQWILQFKYGKQDHMAALLGRLLSLSLRQYEIPIVDGIIPIPLHRKRLQERGFNQALLLARYTFSSKQLFQPHWLQRKRFTSPQTELPPNQRILNMQNAFEAEVQVEGKRLLLIDDVVTTGATLDAAAQALKEAGALSVDAVVLARRMSTITS